MLYPEDKEDLTEDLALVILSRRLLSALLTPCIRYSYLNGIPSGHISPLRLKPYRV